MQLATERAHPRLRVVFAAACVICACGGAATPAKSLPTRSSAPSLSEADPSASSTPPTKLDTTSAGVVGPAKLPSSSTTTVASKPDPSTKEGKDAKDARDAAAKAPAPDVVCARVIKLMDAQLAGAGASLPADQKKSLASDCEAEAKKDRVSDPAGYACDANCIMSAASFDAIESCKSKCPK